MNHIREDKPDQHVLTALEMSCGVLMALELIRSRACDAAASPTYEALEAAGPEARGLNALLELAIEALRDVIAELRMT